LLTVPKTFLFKNIRFAAPPLGKLRWAKPAPPEKQTEIQDGTVGRSCTQASGRAIPGLAVADGEDCLFLDLTVPAKAIEKPDLKLPVMDWIYGGAYGEWSQEL
jgi:carboxylesterase type B